MTSQAPIAWDDLFAFIDEAKVMARRLLVREHATSMHPTELVLAALRRQRCSDQDWNEVSWASREYFFGAIYKAMRRALIDHARLRSTQKQQAVTLVAPEAFSILLEQHDIRRSLETEPEVIDELLQGLQELRVQEPAWAETVDYRFFGGLTLEETASMQGVSVRTVQRNWQRAKLVLYRRIREKLAEG